jgi:hypothetical protein
MLDFAHLSFKLLLDKKVFSSIIGFRIRNERIRFYRMESVNFFDVKFGGWPGESR